LGALATGVAASGFSCVARSNTHCNFGALTVNNLPVVFEVKFDKFTDQLNVTYKFAVPPLKDLMTACIRFVLTRKA